MFFRRLLACARGGALIEFAIVAPVFLVLMMGTVEVCRLMWITQAVNELAFSAARCMAVSTNCSTVDSIRTFAQTRASASALTITSSSDITATANTTCRGLSSAAMVTIPVKFASPMAGLIPIFPATVTATGCFKNS